MDNCDAPDVFLLWWTTLCFIRSRMPIGFTLSVESNDSPSWTREEAESLGGVPLISLALSLAPFLEDFSKSCLCLGKDSSEDIDDSESESSMKDGIT